MATHEFLNNALAELLDEQVQLTLDELARSCAMGPGWVVERVQAGLLQGEQSGGQWRFSSTTVVRARRLARLETTFDADPQLAGMTADLIEEVAQLRQRLRQLQAR
ncbi:chaperone modulatory protein CbpM [Oryzisolibacter propanilivorax]|uniref:Chaperone modulatory protein CbpM n=1 Tax=Oryzisolibacter propanilivorax TaxID=1527607 RepID=A0A1G9S127_9BURK|nr:chaperone modulator CbpM [Oryzisolibacter propanilivorax]SDM29191.1 chaperone modulatory protein CbpM [Oryzisolibacter propanilivorax]